MLFFLNLRGFRDFVILYGFEKILRELLGIFEVYKILWSDTPLFVANYYVSKLTRGYNDGDRVKYSNYRDELVTEN